MRDQQGQREREIRFNSNLQLHLTLHIGNVLLLIANGNWSQQHERQLFISGFE